MIAKNIMKKEVIMINQNQTLKEAVMLMVQKNVSGLPVMDDDGKLIGIITETDILRHGKKIFMPDYIDLLEMFLYRQVPDRYEQELKEALKIKVKETMSSEVVTATENTPVGELALIMIENDINRIPIVKNGKIIGIIGREDIIKAIANIEKSNMG